MSNVCWFTLRHCGRLVCTARVRGDSPASMPTPARSCVFGVSVRYEPSSSWRCGLDARDGEPHQINGPKSTPVPYARGEVKVAPAVRA
jgi:hypothetical protein